jgi:hypothetical protein
MLYSFVLGFMKNRAGYGMLEDSVVSGCGGLRSWLGRWALVCALCSAF